MGNKEIKEFLKICSEIVGDNLKSIVLFGSIAESKNHEFSDYDFCLILKEKCRSEFELKMEIIKRFGKPVDIIFREENEIEWLLKDRSAIDFEIMDKGKVVYGEDIISKYKKLFSKVIRKYNLTKKPELGKGVWEYGY